ncbi:MAG: STAS domain-containing protein [Treponema sp.]|nr:STAS domain-containing protein [Candidatus Treponema equifaecale]
MADNEVFISGFDKARDVDLRISLSQDDELPGVLNVVLVGRIDNYNTAFFQEKMKLILQEGHKKLLFRCAALEYVSSSGFGVFANYFPMVKEQGGAFVFIDVQPKVHEVFKLLGFDHLYGVASDKYDVERLFTDAARKTPEVFPKSFRCPSCESALRATKPGKFRCSKCKIIIKVDDDGVVTIV